MNLLEDWSPSRTGVDPFTWIPLGLMYDLMDIRNDFVSGSVLYPNDNVNGFTNEEFFNALDSDINTLPGFKVRLLNETGSSQSANVISMFSFYNY